MQGFPEARTSKASGAEAPDGVSTVERWAVTVRGIVQGVGFRPFVNRLAREFALAGAVNNFTGGVTIEIEGPAQLLEAFVAALKSDAPPIAVIEDVAWEQVPPTGQQDFVIKPSDAESSGPIFVSPDVAICEDCARELRDPSDRRYRHPFINCTNCGPRFTIIRRIPYDRPYTSMAPFEMCPDCAREYGDIDDRRYHAQPVACPECGPSVWLDEPAEPGAELRGDAAIDRARALLASGHIVAVKGLGGFHLACDAANENAVATLRLRKGREEKPFAVMARSLDIAAKLAHIPREAVELLTSPQAPIILARKNEPEALAPSVAPDSSDYGVMLPYTPLHILLLDRAPYDVLVMTSGNLSDEPICTDNAEAVGRLSGIADAFLLHDREILTACDDSVVRTSSAGPIIMRRSRGYVPFPVKLGHEARPVLAAGAQLKNTFCITSGENAFLSQHIGDLEDLATLEFFDRSVQHMTEILQVQPECVACDLHPDYLSTHHAERVSREYGLPLVRVQHHHAHIASCMADCHYTGRVIGLACDGTGLGSDGTIWGCEVLACDLAEFRRVGYLRPVPLPGGDAAVRRPWRSALAYLGECGLSEHSGWLRDRLSADVAADEYELVEAMLKANVNCPTASSAGRLFDAASALVGLRLASTYEGQAAIALEAAAEPVDDAYEWALDLDDAGMWRMDPAPLLAGLIADVRSGVSAGQMSGRFHNAVAQMLVECAARAASEEGVSHVALSGGTFQNRIVLGRVCSLLEERGLTALRHRSVSPNDGGISLGQAAVADARLRRSKEL